MRILLNSKDLVLKDDTLEINSANPFLENEEERIDNIFSIQIPITGNEVALNYANNIDAIVGNEFTCEIISSINFLGVAIITEVSNENNTATIQIGYAKSNFNYLIKDKMMKELDLGEIICADKLKIKKNGYYSIDETDPNLCLYQLNIDYINGNNKYYKNGQLYFFEAGNIKLNFKGSFIRDTNYRDVVLYYTRNGQTINLIKQYSFGEGTEINTTINISGTAADVITFHFSVAMVDYISYLSCVLDIDCTINNKNFVNEANADENSNYVFPLIRNEKMMDQLPDCNSKSFYNDIRPFLNNVFSVESSFYTTHLSYAYTKLIAPCLRVVFILEKICESVKYKIDKAEFEQIYRKLIVFGSSLIAEYKSDSSNFYIDIPAIFSLNSCFSKDLTISEFLNSLWVITGFFPYFNHTKKEIKLVNQANLLKYTTLIDMIVESDTIDYNKKERGIAVVIKEGEDNFIKDNYSDLEDYNYLGEVSTYSDLRNAEINDCFYVIDERKYYALKFGKATESATINTLYWEFISFDYRLTAQEGDKEFVEFVSDIPILVAIGNTYPGNPNVFTFFPTTEQKIKIKNAYETQGNNFSNSFMMIRGQRSLGQLGNYLFASADNYSLQGQSTEISLRSDGAYGTMQRQYKILSQIYQKGKRHTISGWMRSSEVGKLTYENLIEVDNSVNLLLSYSYTLRDSEFLEVELELIKI